MKIVSYSDIFQKKLESQKSIPELEKHVNGDCIHIGKISPGCISCFKTNQSFAIHVGTKCQLKCPMCYYNNIDNEMLDYFNDIPKTEIKELYKKSLDLNFKPKTVSFNTWGESLLYLNEYEEFSKLLSKIESNNNYNIYKHIYTNGLLLNKENLLILKNMNIQELRVHISASGFSKKVFDYLYDAKEMGFIITIEEPSWPLHKDLLLSHLEIFDKIGISHLNLIEVQYTDYNKDSIEKIYPNALVYKDALHHVYDEGLVYEIMKEVLDKKYNYSVLDCNSGIEKYRNYKSNFFIENDIDNALKEFKC